MAGQRTFTLIPQHPGRNESPEHQPPAARMTSRQVQKAYKAANRAPRMSRAERIKQEKAEQERIRKEFEKEKASAKARAAREKKKGKELAEREEKRKKGLPTVSVRPSQDTIAWFVRGNGTAKKRDSEGRGVGASETPEPVTPCPARGLKLGNIVEEEEEEEKDEAEEAAEPKIPDANTEVEAEAEVEVETDAKGEAEVEAPEQAMDDLDNLDDLNDLGDLDEDFEEDLALELLHDVEASVKKEPIKKPEQNGQQDSPALQRTTTPTMIRDPNPTTRYEQDLGLQRQPRTETPRPKPPLAEPVHHRPSPSPSPPRQEPPMSTQAILFNFDDFFPSSSQQARELEEEIATQQESTARDAAQTKPEQLQPPPEPSLPEPIVDSPSPPPRRFFTSSGSHELMSLALHRSRRTAALEQIQRERIQAGIAVRQAEARARRDKAIAAELRAAELRACAARVAAMSGTRLVSKPPAYKPQKVIERKPQMKPPVEGNKENMKPPQPPVEGNKENIRPLQPLVEGNKENVRPLQPPPGEPQAPSASQETEYGGDWVDELALELM
ncbi:hypothetical protein BGZ61DRAFT_456927, partial [Ilyonectria robusta]|uniref:uncharacterized protein n=1 Tax=Ilyonectria robusta TaxID=1079257 RepID=UPI001E8E8B81